MSGGEVVDPACLWLALGLFVVGVLSFVPGMVGAVRRGPRASRRAALYPPRQEIRARVRWRVAVLLRRLPGVCWVRLVSWVVGNRPLIAPGRRGDDVRSSAAPCRHLIGAGAHLCRRPCVARPLGRRP